MCSENYQDGEEVTCQALAFIGIIRGQDAQKSGTGETIYHVQVMNKPMLRRVAIGASNLQRVATLSIAVDGQ